MCAAPERVRVRGEHGLAMPPAGDQLGRQALPGVAGERAVRLHALEGQVERPGAFGEMYRAAPG